MKRFAWLVLAPLLACSAKNPESTSSNITRTVGELIQLAQQKAFAAENAKRAEMESLAQEGVKASQQCLSRAPEEAACFYWRAVNTGLYYQAHVVGYQKGVKQMIADAERVIQFEPKYANAGAYRLLGELYTELPETSSNANNVVRDLEKAEQYFKTAVQLAPRYPENRLNYAQNLLKQDKKEAAEIELKAAKELVPQWKHDVSYLAWLKDTKKLEGELAKRN